MKDYIIYPWQSTCAMSGEGLYEGLDWLSNNIAKYGLKGIKVMTSKVGYKIVQPVESVLGDIDFYFHKAPNKEEFHRETCHKATSAWGLEARIPFLDKEFIECAMSIDPEWKMIKPDQGRIEKWVLRNAFDDEENPYQSTFCIGRKSNSVMVLVIARLIASKLMLSSK